MVAVGSTRLRWAIFSMATASMHPKRIPKYAGVEGLPYIATKDVGYGFEPLDYDNGILHSPDEEKFRIAHQGAVLICAGRWQRGKKCDRQIATSVSATNCLQMNCMGIFRRDSSSTFICPQPSASFTAAMTGIIGGVSIAKFVEIPIPLPPLEE